MSLKEKGLWVLFTLHISLVEADSHQWGGGAWVESCHQSLVWLCYLLVLSLYTGFRSLLLQMYSLKLFNTWWRNAYTPSHTPIQVASCKSDLRGFLYCDTS